MKTLYFLIRFYNLTLGEVAKLTSLTFEEAYQVLNNGDTKNLEKLLVGLNIPVELFYLLDEEISKNPNYTYKEFLELFKVKINDKENLIGVNYRKDRYNKRVKDSKEPNIKNSMYYYKETPVNIFCNNNSINYVAVTNYIRKQKQKNGGITQEEINKIVEDSIDRKLERTGKINYKHQDLEEYCKIHNISFDLVKKQLLTCDSITDEIIDKIIFNKELIINNFCFENNLSNTTVLIRYNSLEEILDEIDYNILYYLDNYYEYSILVFMHFKYNINTSDELIERMKEIPEKELFNMKRDPQIISMVYEKIKNNKK